MSICIAVISIDQLEASESKLTAHILEGHVKIRLSWIFDRNVIAADQFRYNQCQLRLSKSSSCTITTTQ